MTIEQITDRFIDGVMRLYYKQWKGWEILVLGLVGLFLVVMAIKARREMAASKKHLREHASEIHT